MQTLDNFIAILPNAYEAETFFSLLVEYRSHDQPHSS